MEKAVYVCMQKNVLVSKLVIGSFIQQMYLKEHTSIIHLKTNQAQIKQHDYINDSVV